MDHHEIPVTTPEPTAAGALEDLHALLAEVGASSPLMAYAGETDGEDDAGTLDAMILAGLVAP